MSLSENPAAYIDCRAYLDRALESERGLRITCGSYGEAINLRQRMYKARQLDQKTSMKENPVDDPKYGRSVYDKLSISIKKDEPYVRVMKLENADLKVEEL